MKRQGEEKMMAKANRSYKASLFSDYFSDKKRLIEAYNAIAGTDYPETAEVEFHTIEGVLFSGLYNDIAFTIEGRYVVLIEHQSTVNENMALRLLLYIARVYEGLVPNETLYRQALKKVPTPEFIVIYNGKDPYPERGELRLSDAYIARDKPVQLELTVPVYNISEGNNAGMLSRSKALHDYAAFVAIVGGYEAEGMPRTEAVEKAVHVCSKDGIMETYLEMRGSEVRNMIITEWDNDEAVRVAREEGIEIGLEKGLEKGRAEGEAKGLEKGRAEGEAQSHAQTAARMKADGVDVAVIAKYTGLTISAFGKL
jgi:hypothetical protein